MNKGFVIALVCALAGQVLAQEHSFTDNYCKHEDHDLIMQMIDGHPNALQQIAQDEQALEQFTQQFVANPPESGSNYVIPVVFHIIHNNGPENISDAQVFNAVEIMNRDFNLENTDTSSVVPQFKSLIADVGIEFRLAQKDPNGNCTKGITRIQSQLTYDGDQNMKDLIIWPRNKYLNIWVCNDAAGAAGYSQYPSSVSGPWGLDSDGIVVRYDYTGGIEQSSTYRERTLTHEVGHWLNLRHLWGNSNNPGMASNCSEDDLVGDTPNSEGWTSCNLNGTTCGSLDNVQNYMEYSYCSRMFTTGQKARLLAALNSNTASRNNLHQQANLIATGTDDANVPQLCEAIFTSNIQTVCDGDSVLFTDVSYNGVTSRTWTFQGGTPATSSDSAVWVHFSAPGTYDVGFSATDGNTTGSDNRSGYITVLPNTGIAAPFSEGFENAGQIPNNEWISIDYDNDGSWETTNQTGAWSTHSARLPNTAADDGKVDELLSTSLDMTNASEISVTFRFAYARRNSTNDDKLRLYVSKDCGRTWFLRKQLRGATSLATAPNTSGIFVPGPNDFEFSSNGSFTPDFYVSDFRIKFEFESDGGNYVYLDDINVNGSPVGIAENGTNAIEGLRVFPNPSSGEATVELTGNSAERIEITMHDATGRIVRSVHNGGTAVGTNRITFDASDLAKGFYMIRVTDGLLEKTVGFVKE